MAWHGQAIGAYVIFRPVNLTFYTLIYYLALPFIFFRMWLRSFKDVRYRQRWSERLGFYDGFEFNMKNPGLVFHAVSVGELHAAVPLIRACQLALPAWTFTITTTTVTGSARVTEIFGDSVQHCYLPYDTPSAVKRFFRAINPQALVILETELWPNLLLAALQANCKLLLLNARLSQKSFLKYQKHASLAANMLSAFDVVAAQFQHDAEHFSQLGLPESKLQVCGTMKFDQELDEEQIQSGKALKAKLSRPVLVAGSTREGEEEKVLVAFRQMQVSIPDLLLILVPRHPDRFKEVANLLNTQGQQFAQLSNKEDITPATKVLLGDSLGEMQFYYASADVAFVGGSLVDTGCQNIIEPAALRLPILTGPSLFNFQAVSELLINAGAMQTVANENELATTAVKLFQDQEQCRQMGSAASATVTQHRGATEKQQQLILQAIHSGQ